MTQSKMRTVGTGLLVAGLFALWPSAGAASEPLSVFEDWRGSPTMRSDRWFVREDGQNQEVAVGIQGHRLIMRHRREGATGSNTGAVSSVQALLAQNPANTNRMEVDLQVRKLEVRGCVDNPGLTVVRPARLAVAGFNDGSPGPGVVGDYFIQVLVSAPADSADRSSLLTAQADIMRCVTSDCGGTTSISSVGLAAFPASKPFTLRAAWDRQNHRFLVGVNNDPDVELTYDPALDTQTARGPFTTMRTAMVTASCAAGPTVADLEIAVGEVRTNLSAVIP
jgi:hypothetical protein